MQRALGLDSHVIQLNYILQSNDRAPYRIVVLIRSIVRSFKAAVNSLVQRVKRRRAADAKVGVDEQKTAEKALEMYRQMLEDTFSSSERTDNVMVYVRIWLDCW